MEMTATNIISFDIEEVFHTEYARYQNREGMSYRTRKNITKIFDLLEEYDIKATFFIVGEIVDVFPDLLEEISSRGHEIGFHTHDHVPLWYKSPESFDEEIRIFRRKVEKIGKSLQGFRAPSFSIDQSNRWALDVLIKNGISYDSSIFPMKTPLYGVKGAPRIPYHPSADDLTKEDKERKIIEYPGLVYNLGLFTLPAGGGFYLRILPTWLIKRAIKSLNKEGYPTVLYVHNWELDEDTPILDIGIKNRFITYHNIKQTERKLRELLSTFKFTSFEAILP